MNETGTCITSVPTSHRKHFGKFRAKFTDDDDDDDDDDDNNNNK